MKAKKTTKIKKRIKMRNMPIKARMKRRLDAGTIKETPTEKRLLMSVPDLAEMLLCGDSTIRKMLKAGLPHYKLGKIYRFDEKEVLAWIKENGAALND